MSLLPIRTVAKKLGLNDEDVDYYGRYKAKINLDVMKRVEDKPDGNLILVTAITPTRAGEGKTTTSIALTDGFATIGQPALLCLREPSLGPVFGIKGGATGGGKARIEPSEDINLHFNGDMHALTSSINLIAAIIDNHIFQGNALSIDPNRVVWKRALDMNDRALREVEVGLGQGNGTPRKDGFLITVASELMAIMCLAMDENDFIERINRILVAYNLDGKPIYLSDLRVSHAIMKLMRQALKPNLVQTLEGNPVFVHGGPFANIAHGCNSLIATKLALKLAPMVVTEAGFAADLGAEKFMDIKCHIGGLSPNLVVMVATIRALKLHGGVSSEKLLEENVEALVEGTKNLQQHLENMQKFGVPVLVAINHFADDHASEVEALTAWCQEHHYLVSFVDSYLLGGQGAADLARKAVTLLNQPVEPFKFLYNLNLSIEEKITVICRQIYRAGDIIFTETAKNQIETYRKLGYDSLPVCMAKTPQSFTDNPEIIGAPTNFPMTIREVNLSAGAGFVVAITGKILTMPGLPKIPSAVRMEDEPY